MEGKFPTGLQVVGPIADFANPTNRKLMIRNLAAAKEHGISNIVIHAPLQREDHYSKSTNLSEPEGLETLKTVFYLANESEADVVTVHTEVFCTHYQMRSLTDKKRQHLKEAIAKNLKKLEKGKVILAIENMGYPLMGDTIICSKDMVYDPFFVDPLELYGFAQDNDIRITFDVCHWATLCLPIPLRDIFRRIEDRVAHLHLSDAYGRWISGASLFKEGLVPGEGNLGEDNFRQLLSYLQECKRPNLITFEIKDKNHRNPKELERGLIKVLSWLNKQPTSR